MMRSVISFDLSVIHPLFVEPFEHIVRLFGLLQLEDRFIEQLALGLCD